MSTVGQAAGYLVGGIIGSIVPGVGTMIGAQIGGMIGGYIDPPKGKNIEGPRLSDLSVQTATYGAPIPIIYGTAPTMGNIFWVENNQLKEASTTSSGGKGGSGQRSTTYSYSATFAIGICKGPIHGIKRIWFRGKLVYDGFASDAGVILVNDDFTAQFTLYLGTDTQLPDERMQATLGIANTPAYRGLAYAVFKDLPTEDWGNSLEALQIKFEVVAPPIQSGWRTELMRDEYAATGIEKNFDVAPGPAYIRSITDGVVNVNCYGSDIDYQFSVSTGELVGVTTGPMMLGPQPVECDPYLHPWAPLGRADNGEQVYVLTLDSPTEHYYHRGIIGFGPLFYNTVTTSVDIRGAIISQEIEDARVAAGMSNVWLPSKCCFNKGNTQIFLITTDGDWYLIDLDGNILEAHTDASWRINSDINVGSYAWSGGQTKSFACDFSVRRCSLACDGSLDIYAIAKNGTITVESNFSASNYVIGDHSSIEPSAQYMDGNVIVMIHGASMQVVVYGPTDADDITLGEIVSAECRLSKMLTAGDIDVSELTQVVRGYKVSQTAPIRSALEPLRSAWPFDVVQHGYQLKFKRRGSTSVATIDVSELGAVAGADKPGVQITLAREMDMQIPRRVELTYLDVNREYDIGEQFAERLNTDAVNVSRVELAIVLNGGEVAGMAEVLLYMYWLERRDVPFVLPPPYGYLEPADVITINGDAAIYELRLEETSELTDGRIECKAKFNATAIYTPTTARGEEGSVTGQVITVPGPCELLLLDVPCVNSTYMNAPGMLSGLSGLLPGWKGGTIFRSDDGGQAWAAVQGIQAPGAISGTVSTAIGAGTTHVIDTSNSLKAWVHGGVLTSVSDAALFNGANHFAYGAHGRWEVIGAKSVVSEIDGSYTLSNLMRGRFGTEWAMTTHADFDKLVLLDAAVLRFIAMNPASINSERLWKGANNGASIESISSVSNTYTAENLRCLAPVWLRGHADPSTYNMTVEFERRSRIPVEPFSGLPTPIGESSELYEVEIWDSGFSTLKRTITGLSSKQATWTGAQQIADFGDYQTEANVRVYQLSPVTGRGRYLQGTIQHNVLGDPFWSNVSLLMHMNGSNGGTSFIDQKGKSVTVYGDAQTSTAQSVFSGSSGKIDGAGDYLGLAASSDFDFGSGDFTWEAWIYWSAVTSGTYADAIWCSQAGPVGFAVAIFADGKIGITVDSPAGGDWDIRRGCDPGDPRGSTAIPMSSWVHIAVSRSGSNWRGFVNGAIDQTFSSSAAISAAPSGYFVGHWHDGNARCFNGHIAELRITKGICRYNAAFTPPVAPFPDM